MPPRGSPVRAEGKVPQPDASRHPRARHTPSVARRDDPSRRLAVRCTDLSAIAITSGVPGTEPRMVAINGGSCWIPGSYTLWTVRKHLISKGSFQRDSIGHDPRGKPVKTSCYANIGP